MQLHHSTLLHFTQEDNNKLRRVIIITNNLHMCNHSHQPQFMEAITKEEETITNTQVMEQAITKEEAAIIIPPTTTPDTRELRASMATKVIKEGTIRPRSQATINQCTTLKELVSAATSRITISSQSLRALSNQRQAYHRAAMVTMHPSLVDRLDIILRLRVSIQSLLHLLRQPTMLLHKASSTSQKPKPTMLQPPLGFKASKMVLPKPSQAGKLLQISSQI